MGRKKYDGVYEDDKGILWAYYDGKKKSANTNAVAQSLYQELKDEDDRCRITAGEGRLGHEEVVILRGVPGCGKSTWAREFMETRSSYKRFSRDVLREMFDFGGYNPKFEEFIKTMRYRAIRDLLQDGWSVIVDDTNLKDRDIRRIKEAAYFHNRVIGVDRMVAVPVRIVDFDTPLVECTRRDALRPKPVGADRITVMWYESHKINSEKEHRAYIEAKQRLED